MLKRVTKFLTTFFAATVLLSMSYAYSNNNESYAVSANYKNVTITSLTSPPDSKSVIPIDMLSPKKQIEQGIPPLGIVCKLGFQLILKLSDISPACVKPSSIDKLVERGWAQSQDWRNHD